jgi:hypothetical protein
LERCPALTAVSGGCVRRTRHIRTVSDAQLVDQSKTSAVQRQCPPSTNPIGIIRHADWAGIARNSSIAGDIEISGIHAGAYSVQK